MKRLLLSTAILGAATFPAWAQDQSVFRQAPDAMEIRASDFMGMRVYATESAVEGEEIQGLQEGWEDIGEVNDIVMDRTGAVQAVLVDIGGFLGIGERQVALSMDALNFVSDSATADQASDFFLVVNTTRQQLEQAPEYEANAGDMNAEQAAEQTDQAIEEGGATVAAAAGAAAGAVGAAVEGTEQAVQNAGQEVSEEVAQADATAETQTEQEMATDETAAAASGDNVTVTTVEGDNAQTATADATATDGTEVQDTELTSADATPMREPIAREGYVALGREELTADRLEGATVYGANDERVGEVGDIVLTAEGQVQDLVIDVGGFLGIGEKPVALSLDSVDILQADGGDDIRVYVSQTKEELEQMDRYEAQ